MKEQVVSFERKPDAKTMEQHHPTGLSTVMGVAGTCTAPCSGHWPCAACLLEACLLPGGNWILYFILINLNLHSHLWLLATVLDSAAAGNARDAARQLTSWRIFQGNIGHSRILETRSPKANSVPRPCLRRRFQCNASLPPPPLPPPPPGAHERGFTSQRRRCVFQFGKHFLHRWGN